MGGRIVRGSAGKIARMFGRFSQAVALICAFLAFAISCFPEPIGRVKLSVGNVALQLDAFVTIYWHQRSLISLDNRLVLAALAIWPLLGIATWIRHARKLRGFPIESKAREQKDPD